MKKALAFALTTVICTVGLTACGKKADVAPQSDEPPAPQTQIEQTAPDTAISSKPPRKNIEITIDGFQRIFDSSPAIRGVKRTFTPSFAGNYTVEYVHVPYGVDRDDTLDYTVNINADHTYTMTVVSNGVTSNHEGRWYARHDSITFFYDESIDTPEHNVYVSDCLFAERLSGGKIMLYDNCHTVVLSRADEPDTDVAEQRLERAQSYYSDANSY